MDWGECSLPETVQLALDRKKWITVPDLQRLSVIINAEVAPPPLKMGLASKLDLITQFTKYEH